MLIVESIWRVLPQVASMRVPYLVSCNLLLLVFIYVPTALTICPHSFYLRIPFLHVSSRSIRLFNTIISILAQHLILDVQKMEPEKINCLGRQHVDFYNSS